MFLFLQEIGKFFETFGYIYIYIYMSTWLGKYFDKKLRKDRVINFELIVRYRGL